MRTRNYRSQLEAICNNASMALFIMDDRQHCIYLNPAAEQLTGFSLAELQGAPLHDFIHHTHPDGRPFPLEECAIDRACPRDAREQGEEVFIHKDGHFYPVAFTASPIREGHRVVGTVIEVQEIGERRRREQHQRFLSDISADFDTLSGVEPLMQRTGAKLCRYLGLASCSFAQVDASTDSVTIEHAWQQQGSPSLRQTFRLSDYLSAECISGFHAGQALVVCDSQCDPRLNAESHAQLQLHAFIAVPGFRDQRWNYLLAAFDSHPRRWREDEIELVREFARRVFPRVERARAEEALSASEARYRALFEAIDQAFCVLQIVHDDQGLPCDLLFLEVNPAFARHTGLENAQGQRIRALVPDYEQKWVDLYARVVATGEPARFLDYAPSLERWFQAEAFRTGPASEQQVAVLFSDITAAKLAEEALQHAHTQLLENDRRKDEFLAMLAHELRNPLAAVRGAVSWLGRHAQAAVPSRQLEILERQSQALNALVDDLLDVSRVTRGLVTLHNAPVDLRAIVEQAISSARPLMESREHQVSVSLPQQVVCVHGDALRLEQILSNLLTNAAKYTDPRGTICVALDTAGGEAVLRVRDNGIGIAPDVLPTIFELFVQAERGLDRTQGGLGIGLTITRDLVEQHGGSIEAHSAGRGQGAEFVVHLPLFADAPQALEAPSSAAVAASAHLRVLVVDDNRDIAETFAMLIADGGHEVRMALDGPHALEMAEAFRPHVALLDIGLPGMDGYELARRLRQRYAPSELVLCAVSGYGDPASLERSQAAGFDKHLTKPVNLDVLEAFIGEVSPR